MDACIILILRFTGSALWDIRDGVEPIHTKVSGTEVLSFAGGGARTHDLPISCSCQPHCGLPLTRFLDLVERKNIYQNQSINFPRNTTTYIIALRHTDLVGRKKKNLNQTIHL